jgi:hypothetical protein
MPDHRSKNGSRNQGLPLLKTNDFHAAFFLAQKRPFCSRFCCPVRILWVCGFACTGG